MQITQNSVNGMQQFSLEALLHEQRIIEVKGDITDDSAMDFANQVLYHARMDANRPVKIIFNSPGGSVDAGMLMYDFMQTAGVPLEVCT